MAAAKRPCALHLRATEVTEREIWLKANRATKSAGCLGILPQSKRNRTADAKGAGAPGIPLRELGG